jgi:hypothetical protein
MSLLQLLALEQELPGTIDLGTRKPWINKPSPCYYFHELLL